MRVDGGEQVPFRPRTAVVVVAAARDQRWNILDR